MLKPVRNLGLRLGIVFNISFFSLYNPANANCHFLIGLKKVRIHPNDLF